MLDSDKTRDQLLAELASLRTQVAGRKAPAQATPLPGMPFLRMLDPAPVGFALHDRELRYLFINEPLAAINGVPAADHIGRTACEVLPVLGQQMGLILEQVRDSGRPVVNIEISGRTSASPGIRHWLGNFYSVRFSEGDAPGVAAFIHEITEQKLVEVALRESEERYHRVVEDQNELICRYLPDGSLSFVNDAYLRYYGLIREETLGTCFVPRIPESDQEAIQRHLRSLTPGNPSVNFTHRIILPSGEERWQQWTHRAIYSPAGELVEHQAVGADVTERKRAEAALSESETKYRQLFESSRDALMVITPLSWNFTDANPATLHLFGAASKADFSTHGPWDVSPERQPDGRPSVEKAQEMIACALREGSHSFKWEHQRLNGEPFAAEVLLTRIETGGLVRVQATVRDITERKRTEARLVEMMNKAEAANVAKSDFLANMSHELTTPLNAVIGFSEVLLDRFFGELNDKQAEYVNIIREGGLRLLSRLTDILQMAKLDSGDEALDLAPAFPAALLRETLDMCREKALLHGIVLELDLGPDLEQATWLDEGKFRQVLFALLGNAVKFTPDNGRVRLTGRRVQKDGAEILEVGVEDSGPGIPSEFLPHLFIPFSQVEKPQTKQHAGIGLGLALARRLARLQGGEVELAQTSAQGSRLVFILPLRDAAPGSADAGQEPPSGQGPGAT